MEGEGDSDDDNNFLLKNYREDWELRFLQIGLLQPQKLQEASQLNSVKLTILEIGTTTVSNQKFVKGNKRYIHHSQNLRQLTLLGHFIGVNMNDSSDTTCYRH